MNGTNTNSVKIQERNILDQLKDECEAYIQARKDYQFALDNVVCLEKDENDQSPKLYRKASELRDIARDDVKEKRYQYLQTYTKALGITNKDVKEIEKEALEKAHVLENLKKPMAFSKCALIVGGFALTGAAIGASVSTGLAAKALIPLALFGCIPIIGQSIAAGGTVGLGAFIALATLVGATAGAIVGGIVAYKKYQNSKPVFNFFDNEPQKASSRPLPDLDSKVIAASPGMATA